MKVVMIQSLTDNMIVTGIAQQRGNIRLRSERTPFSTELQTWLTSVGVTHVYVEEDTIAETGEVDSHNAHHHSVTHLLLKEAKQSAAQSPTNHLQSGLYLSASEASESVINIYLQHVRRGAAVVTLAFLLGLMSNLASRWWLNSNDNQTVVAGLVEQVESKAQGLMVSDTNNNMVLEQSANSEDMPRQLSVSESPQFDNDSSTVKTPEKAALAIVESSQTKLDTEQTGLQSDGRDSQGDGISLSEVPSADTEFSSNLIQTESQAAVKAEISTETQSEPISPELLAIFEQAIQNVDQSEPAEEPVDDVPSDIPRIDQIPPRLMTKIPSLAYNAHMYASEPSDRWININDLVRREGDSVEGVLTLVEITPQHAVLAIDGYEFTLRALTDW